MTFRTDEPAGHWWRELVVDAWRCADQAWQDRREAVAIGYATEEAEFAEANPRPKLSDFMVHLSSGVLAPDRALGGRA